LTLTLAGTYDEGEDTLLEALCADAHGLVATDARIVLRLVLSECFSKQEPPIIYHSNLGADVLIDDSLRTSAKQRSKAGVLLWNSIMKVVLGDKAAAALKQNAHANSYVYLLIDAVSACVCSLYTPDANAHTSSRMQ
jgi:hypothetical protein